MIGKLYSTKEFAKLIGKNEKTIRRWNQSGKLIPVKIDEKGYFYYSYEQGRTLIIKTWPESAPGVQSRTPQKYKTKKLAESNNSNTKALIVSNYPDNIATPTYKPYQYATSLFQDGKAHLQAGIDTSKLKLREGKLFFEDENSKALRELTEVELKNCRTWEPITEVTGLPFLRAYYSILLSTYQEALRQGKPLNPTIKIYVPDLLEYLGLQRNAHKQTIDKIVNQMVSFNNVIGVMNYTRNGKPRQSYYAIFLFGKYEEQTNTITVWSPYLIKVIEQAGNFTPNIKASTIIERNPIFKYRLDETNANHKGRLLERVFKHTWELLREQTRLMEIYKNIKLPDPNDSKNIPTTKTLNMVFSFPHDGKIK